MSASLEQLFTAEVARSHGAKDYLPGPIPFVTSTTANNGVDRYVEPDPAHDRVFDGPRIAISGLGYATLQLERFLPKGNGGDSLTILIPRRHMPESELLAFVALFNLLHGWRFSYGRKAKLDRLMHLEVPLPFPDTAAAILRESRSLDRLSQAVQTRFASPPND